MDRVLYPVDGFWRRLDGSEVLKNYPLMSGGPIPIVCIICAYLYFVKVLGPKLMDSKKPYDLMWTIRMYNIFVSGFYGYLFYKASALTNYGLDYFGCKHVEGQLLAELQPIGYMYFLTKIFELMDTVFFILRKKNKQASNLHVFHHTLMLSIAWIYLRIQPSGGSVLFPYLNGGFHVILYAYYFLATFKGLHKYLWWKRQLTILEMAQFALTIVHYSYQMLTGCESIMMSSFGIGGSALFLFLFVNFYRYTYGSKSRPSIEAGKREYTS